MVSVFGSLLGKLFSIEKKAEKGIVQEGQGNVATVITVESGDTKAVEAVMKATRPQHKKFRKSDDENIVRDLKEDILKNSGGMPLIDLINKTSSIAGLKGDTEMVDWLKHELHGYPNDYKDVPEYRKVNIKLDVGLHSTTGEGFVDLRDTLIGVIYGGGLSSLSNAVDEPHRFRITFVAPMEKTFMKLIKDRGLKFESNFNMERAPYIIDSTEIASLVCGLKHKILVYVSGA